MTDIARLPMYPFMQWAPAKICSKGPTTTLKSSIKWQSALALDVGSRLRRSRNLGSTAHNDVTKTSRPIV